MLIISAGRSRLAQVVETIPGQYATVQRPSSAASFTELDAKRRIRLGGNPDDSSPDLWVVQW